MKKTGKRLMLISMIVLGLTLVLLSLGAVPVLSMQHEYGEPQLPANIMPVIIVSGSDYEMGYQYGQQAGEVLDVAKFRHRGDVAHLSEEELLLGLKVGQHYINEYAPEAVDIFRGMVDGATDAGYDLTYNDVLLLNDAFQGPRPDYDYPEGVDELELPLDGECNVFSAWGNTTADGRLICGDSQDLEEWHQLLLIAFPDKGNNYMATVRAGHLAEHFGMNNKGLFQGASGGYAIGDIHTGYGICRSVAYQHLLRFADNATEAKDMFLPWDYPGSTSLHLSDVSGNAYVIEATSALKAVRKPGDFGEGDFIVSSNNYWCDEMKEAIKGELQIDLGGWYARQSGGARLFHATSRNMGMTTKLQQFAGDVDLDFAKMMWRFTGESPIKDGWPYDDFDTYIESNGEGWDPKMCNLSNIRVAIAMPDDGDEGLAYICTGPAGIAYPHRPRYDTFRADGTNSFYEMKLASTPAALVSAAQATAKENIREAYHLVIEPLQYKAAIDPKNDLFSKVVREYSEGELNMHMGRAASGNEALAHFAKAASWFARAQAHAKQLTHTEYPPATCPEDLGLQSWKVPKWQQEADSLLNKMDKKH